MVRSASRRPRAAGSRRCAARSTSCSPSTTASSAGHTDSYGFTWLVRETTPDDVEGLVTDLHGVNTSLVDAGFGPALLCTLVAFTNGTQSLGLVYLYKRGSWYPFVPVGADRRDNATELQIKSFIGTDLRLEQDLARWFPVYGAPGVRLRG